jgi:hypothetical protein
MRPMLIVMAGAAILIVAAIIVAVGRDHKPAGADPVRLAAPVAPPRTLPRTPGTYLGVYAARGSLCMRGCPPTWFSLSHAGCRVVLQRLV